MGRYVHVFKRFEGPQPQHHDFKCNGHVLEVQATTVMLLKRVKKTFSQPGPKSQTSTSRASSIAPLTFN